MRSDKRTVITVPVRADGNSYNINYPAYTENSGGKQVNNAGADFTGVKSVHTKISEENAKNKSCHFALSGRYCIRDESFRVDIRYSVRVVYHSCGRRTRIIRNSAAYADIDCRFFLILGLLVFMTAVFADISVHRRSAGRTVFCHL